MIIVESNAVVLNEEQKRAKDNLLSDTDICHQFVTRQTQSLTE